jgi:hypothetical protein
MRADDVKNLTKDTAVIFKGQQCLLHRCSNNVYLLSDLGEYEGSTCGDFYRYRGQYRYSFWLIDKADDTYDNRFVEICQQLVPLSLGEL